MIPIYRSSDLRKQGFRPTVFATKDYSFAWLQDTLQRLDIAYENASVFHVGNGYWQLFTKGEIKSFKQEALLP